MGEEFDYAKEFQSLDLDAVVKDLTGADDRFAGLVAGRLRPLRAAVHPDGVAQRRHLSHPRRARRRRSGQQRFAPLNSWPDNANLDKARRLLWPIKQKYGPQDLLGRSHDPRPATSRSNRWASRPSASPADARTAGSPTIPSTGVRKARGSADERYSGERELENPLGAVQMGLIYVNPEGPNGKPDPVAAARDIRETFKRMAMNDEETVALIAGGHTFGKTHGAADASQCRPRAGRRARSRIRASAGRTSSAPARAMTRSPAASKSSGPDADEVEQPLLREPVRLRMGADEEPGRAPISGRRRAAPERRRFPIRSIQSKRRSPSMLTTDLALRIDPAYEKISRRFFEHPDQFADAFARAWFKLTHRDMGPIVRYLGPLVPKETLIWQDPIPAVDHPLVDDKDIAASRRKSWPPGLSVPELVSTAWASASTFRGGDKRGGGNGARIRLAPQKDWDVNQPAQLGQGAWKTRGDPEGVQRFGLGRQEGLARRPDRSRRRSGGREGRQGRRPRREGPLHARTHGRFAGGDRRRVVRRLEPPPTGSATTRAARSAHARAGAGRPARNC